jgi:hypothetical protein
LKHSIILKTDLVDIREIFKKLVKSPETEKVIGVLLETEGPSENQPGAGKNRALSSG